MAFITIAGAHTSRADEATYGFGAQCKEDSERLKPGIDKRAEAFRAQYSGLKKRAPALFREAIDEFSLAIRSKPKCLSAYYQRARLKKALVDYPGALKDLNTIFKLLGDNASPEKLNKTKDYKTVSQLSSVLNLQIRIFLKAIQLQKQLN